MVEEVHSTEPSALPVAQLVTALASAPPDRISPLVAEIIRRFEPLMRRTWYRLGGSATDYGDFRQEAHLKLFRALPQLQDPAAFPGFFRRVIVNVAYDELRRSVVHTKRVVPLDDYMFSTDEEHILDEIDEAIVIRSYLDTLPPREREVLQLEYFDGHSIGDIARQWGITAGAVRMAKSRAINRLRNVLAKKSNVGKQPREDE